MAFVCKMTDTAGVTGPIASGIYGTCSTAAATAAKVVTCADLDKLIVGCVIYVKFDYGNTVADATLNVNSLGAKAVICGTSGTATPPSTLVKTATNNVASWFSGEVVGFMYDEISSTGYWRIVSQTHARFTTLSIGSASAGTAISVPTWTFSDVTASKATAGTAISVPNVTSVGSVPTLKWVNVSIPNVTGNSNVTIPNVTNVADVTIPNVTGNSNVTFYGVDTINTVVTSATISEGVLTFSTGASITKTAQKTASKVTLGTALSASKVTLGTALSASKVTLGDALTASYLGDSSETTPTWSAGSTPTLGTAISVPTWSFSDVTASKATAGTAISVPNISVSSKTVLTTR